MDPAIEEIKSRLDIAEFIKSYVRLEKAGVNFRAPCPFHSEKTPSFFVSPGRQRWHCFGGCGEGGDVFSFLMKMEGLDFPEALRALADRTGVVLTKENPAARSERNRLYDACEMTAKIFEYTLSRKPSVKEYLKNRGLTPETIKAFRIGFAQPSWDFLLRALTERGFKSEEIERAGLAIAKTNDSRRNGGYYDRFRGRIMFPITDANGRVVGFGGRIFRENPERPEAKYMNSPQTKIYDKSRVLYGFDKAKQSIRTHEAAVIVEGYMDCIMSHQAGVTNTVAISGTALTHEQLRILKRLSHTLISSFDTDAAGEQATLRALALASPLGFDLKIARIPNGKDPADAVLEDAAIWPQAVAEANSVLDFYFKKAFSEQHPNTPEGKKNITALLLPFIAECSDEIQKAHWVGTLAHQLAIPESSVWTELEKIHSSETAPNQTGSTLHAPANSAPKPRHLILEERLLSLASALKPDVLRNILTNKEIAFHTPIHQELFMHLTEKTKETKSPEHLIDRLAAFALQGDVLAESVADIHAEFATCAYELQKHTLKEQLERIATTIRQQEQHGAPERAAQSLQEFQNVSNKLKELG